MVGIAAGLIGVAVSRSLFGPAAAPIGIAIGAAALLSGTLFSWRVHGRRPPPESPGLPRALRLQRRVHPVAWIGPVAASVITMAAWVGVAHSSGSGWVQAVGALLGAFLLIGLVAPALPARGARLTCTVSPSDGCAGQPVELTIEANRPVRIRTLFPPGPAVQSGGSQRGSRSATLHCTPQRRGVLDSVVVEVASSAPFGLLWWAREIELPLSRLLHVAPRMGTPGRSTQTGDQWPGEATPRVPSGVGEPRGIRPYAPGDPRHAVHWPATSHAGVLMVRESERPTDNPIFIDLQLPRDTAGAEASAEQTMADASINLARQQSVVLATDEVGGRVVRAVADQTDLGRRLARAVSL